MLVVFEGDDHGVLLLLDVKVKVGGAGGGERDVNIFASGENESVAFGLEGLQYIGVGRLAGFADGFLGGVVVGLDDAVEVFLVRLHNAEKNFGVVVIEADRVADPHFFLLRIANGMAQVVEHDEVSLGVRYKFRMDATVDDAGLRGRFLFTGFGAVCGPA